MIVSLKICFRLIQLYSNVMHAYDSAKMGCERLQKRQGNISMYKSSQENFESIREDFHLI